MAVKIFVVGATGYQGSTLIANLLAHESKYEVTALVRTEQKGAKLREQGCRIIIGDLSATEALQQGATQADVVFSLASADDLAPVQTLVEALKPKGKKGVLIHTSGTSVLADDSKSEFASDTVYSDKSPEQVEQLPDTQMHIEVDNWIRANSSDITALIVCPPTIYGEAGDPQRASVQIPLIVKGMCKSNKAALVGAGKAMWNYVHVRDLAHFYVMLMTMALEPDMAAPDRKDMSGFYFIESGEFAWRDLFAAVAAALVDQGALEPFSEMGTFSEQEMRDHMMGDTTWAVVGCNARCKAERARALGWKPTQPGLLECVPGDVKRALATM